MTVTGSIGVIFAKFALGEFVKGMHASSDRVALDESNCTLNSWRSKFSDKDMKLVDGVVGRMYDFFKKYVGDGRKISAEEVEKRAQGKVFWGSEAKKLGLVDELGDHVAALKWIAKDLGLGDYRELEVENYPKKLSPLKALLTKKPRRSSDDPGTSADGLTEGLSTVAGELIGATLSTLTRGTGLEGVVSKSSFSPGCAGGFPLAPASQSSQFQAVAGTPVPGLC